MQNANSTESFGADENASYDAAASDLELYLDAALMVGAILVFGLPK